MIKKTLPEWLEEKNPEIEGVEDPQAIIKTFEKWTIYFRGFNENRQNFYTDQAKSTSISYRLIHENLPRFIDNIKRYKDAKALNVDFSEVEKSFAAKLDEVFSLEYYNHCLTQKGIDVYNQITGGRSEKGNVKKQGVNEKINLHAQKLKSKISNASDEGKKELEEKSKKVRSCKLEKLHKQILSDSSERSFRLDEIDSDSSLCEAIVSTFEIDDDENLIGKTKDGDFNITKNVEESLRSLKNSNPEKVYVNNRSITVISQNLFKSWNTINNCLEYYAENKRYPVPEGKKETKTLLDQREKWLKQSYFSFADIHKALETYFEQYAEDEFKNEQKHEEINDRLNIKEQKEIAKSKPLFGYFEGLIIRKKDEKNKIFEAKHLLEEIQRTFKEVPTILEEYRNVDEEKLKNEKGKVQKVKLYLDALMDLQNFLKPLFIQLNKKEEEKAIELYEKDTGFYEGFDSLFEVVKQIVPLYNRTRNYLTKKPYSVEKYKLNFENSTLADGWDKNKEKDNTCVLLMKDGQYFLGIMDMDKKHKKIFEGDLPDEGQCYKKIIYKQISDASKDIQNLICINGKFQRKTKKLDELKEKHIPDIAKIRSCQSYKTTNKNFNKEDLITFINYYKKAATKYWDWCDFSFRESDKYDSFKDFTDHVNSQGYKIDFQNISETYIDDCVKKGKLYLFQIYSKDFSPKSRGKPNLQTLYWKALFDEKNRRDIIYKLNGKAELFHRKKSIEYSQLIWDKGHHAGKIRQKYPIIKDRRYAQDTYLFHVSIQCNFKAGAKKPDDFNREVRDSLKDNSEVNIIGIDRGERHLAYYTIINQKGEILKNANGEYLQSSLNKPLGEKDYQALLHKREKERDDARKSWGTIERIKDLKEGYLSQVVHKIAKLMVEHKAVVVFEDLNFGFKRERFKVEKQVYQKLEKMLIDKLNYLVFKDKEPDETGGLLNALQLTAPVGSFRELGKQTGFVFYVPAYHTSKVCPATGFVNLLYPKYETVKKAREFFKKFNKICFNKNCFEFHFDYEKFTNKAEGSRQDWVLCSYGVRLENFKNKQNNQWDTREINLNDEIEKLFKDNSIDCNNGQCLIEKIVQQDKSEFFKSLLRLLRLTLQMRNSKIGTDEDWLISPVKGSKGNFFDSRKADVSMPQNADANGAYHIALKGLLMLEQLREREDVETFKPNLSNEKWYEFLAKRYENKSGN